MPPNALQPDAACQYYYSLLQRYARRLIKDDKAASKLVAELLADKCENQGLQVDTYHRRRLQQATRLQCFYWQQAQVFDRGGVKVEEMVTNDNKHTK